MNSKSRLVQDQSPICSNFRLIQWSIHTQAETHDLCHRWSIDQRSTFSCDVLLPEGHFYSDLIFQFRDPDTKSSTSARTRDKKKQFGRRQQLDLLSAFPMHLFDDYWIWIRVDNCAAAITTDVTRCHVLVVMCTLDLVRKFKNLDHFQVIVLFDDVFECCWRVWILLLLVGMSHPSTVCLVDGFHESFRQYRDKVCLSSFVRWLHWRLHLLVD